MIDSVETLLQRMTLKEKVGQMTQVTLDVILEGEIYKVTQPHQISPEKIQQAIVEYGVGSILNIAQDCFSLSEWHYLLGAIQKKASETRLQIPVLYGIDSVHGANFIKEATFFPHQIGLAATWNVEIAKEVAQVTAYETRAAGIPWTFSPVQDICRSQLWPRLYETFGEDSLLCAEMGAAMVQGYEGKGLACGDQVSSCLKHFVGYGMPISGKDRTPAWISERYLRMYFLPPFKKAIEAGAHTIMVNSGEINGIPVHANKAILTGILREEMGFNGLLVTDWEDIRYLHDRHKVATSHKEAVRMAIEAGIDMSMVPTDFSFADLLLELVEEGTISEIRIDESVRRILELKNKLGLFEHPIHLKSFSYDQFGSATFQRLALKAAQESITLLKNGQGALPLSKKAKVLVMGCSADSMRALNGGWTYTWQGEKTDQYASNEITILKAIQQKIGMENVAYLEGCDFEQITDLDRFEDISIPFDHIILCLGETSYTEFSGNTHDLTLPMAQLQVAQKAIQSGKPVTLVLLEGRPRLIQAIRKDVSAIVLGYLPGHQGGYAIADVLFGDYNPCGKLPYTYPKYPNALNTYDYKVSERLSMQDSADTIDNEFDFGFGLSYTTFSYSNLRVSKSEVEKEDTLEITVQITNSGERAGAEVVQLYVRDEYASITPPNRTLKGFQKIWLEAGAAQTVSFFLEMTDLAFVGIDNKWRVEAGDFRIFIGDLEQNFVLI